jgi:hypothetical protein
LIHSFNKNKGEKDITASIKSILLITTICGNDKIIMVKINGIIKIDDIKINVFMFFLGFVSRQSGNLSKY